MFLDHRANLEGKQMVDRSLSTALTKGRNGAAAGANNAERLLYDTVLLEQKLGGIFVFLLVLLPIFIQVQTTAKHFYTNGHKTSRRKKLSFSAHIFW